MGGRTPQGRAGAPDTARAAREGVAPRRRGGKTLAELFCARNMLILATAVLLGYGVVMTYSVTSITEVSATAGSQGLMDMLMATGKSLLSELAFVAAGCVLALGLSRLSYKVLLGKMLVVIWAVTVAALVVTVAMGQTAYGATRWLQIGGLSLQPSEFAKITIVLVAARVLCAVHDGAYVSRAQVVLAAASVILPILLIFAQRDMGTIVILVAALYVMLALSGASRKVLVGILVAGVVVAMLLVRYESYRMGRIAAWLGDVIYDPQLSSDEGYQLKHGLYALGSGGLWGTGIGTSRLKYGYLTQAENDFIFAIIGEELGLVRGVLPIILAFGLFLWSGMRIARDARDLSGTLLASGLTFSIVVQAFVNIGGVVKLIPETGRTLPFISSGGSSLIASMLVVGVILSVDTATRREAEEAPRRARRGFNVIEGGRAPARRAPQQARPEGVARDERDAAVEKPGRAPRAPRTTRAGRGTRQPAGTGRDAGHARPAATADETGGGGSAPARRGRPARHQDERERS